jgi:hypothetical protein
VKALYPEVEVELSGQDGNAFAIIGRVTSAMRHARLPEAALSAFQVEAMSGDYDNVLRTAVRWVSVS